MNGEGKTEQGGLTFECCVPTSKGDGADDGLLHWKKHSMNIPAGVHARSNEADAELGTSADWEKTKFARLGVEKALRDILKHKLKGKMGADKIVQAISQVLGETKREFKMPGNLEATTTLEIWKERICQQGPFIRAEEMGWHGYGTRAQVALVVSRSDKTAYIFYRSTQSDCATTDAVNRIPWKVFACERPGHTTAQQEQQQRRRRQDTPLSSRADPSPSKVFDAMSSTSSSRSLSVVRHQRAILTTIARSVVSVAFVLGVLAKHLL